MGNSRTKRERGGIERGKGEACEGADEVKLLILLVVVKCF